MFSIQALSNAHTPGMSESASESRGSPRPSARRSRSAHPAFTLVDLLVVIIILVVILGILLPAFGGSHRHGGGRQMKDSTQVRGIQQAMVIWAASNKGQYPLPSDIDPENLTVGEEGEHKNTTANILSVLIMNGHISPEICISPAEANTGEIQRYDTYEYTNPTAAAIPSKALWDPAFRGTPQDQFRLHGVAIPGSVDPKPGNQSYAHLLPFGNRRSMWADTYNATEPVFGNRGPTYAANDMAPSRADKWPLTPDKYGTTSNTLLIHGGRNTWEGNIAYNDNHVNFETKPAPDGITMSIKTATGKSKAPDNLFVNETDEHEGDAGTGRIDQGRNAYLRPVAEVTDWMRPRTWRD